MRTLRRASLGGYDAGRYSDQRLHADRLVHEDMQIATSRANIRMSGRVPDLGQRFPRGEGQAHKRVPAMVDGELLQTLRP